MTEAAARKYVAALNALLSRDPENGGRASGLALTKECVVALWTRDKSADCGLDRAHLAPMRSETPSPAMPLAPPTPPDSPLYVLSLGANSSRVVVRDWLETTTGRAAANLSRWQDDLRLLPQDGSDPLPLKTLIGAVAGTLEGHHGPSGLSPALVTAALRSAINGDPLPRAVASSVLPLMCVQHPPREHVQSVLRARVGIIKAALLRSGWDVPAALDDDVTREGYLLGRLFAALEKLALVARGTGRDLASTIRDRFYGAASFAPATHFPHLLRSSAHHAVQARYDGLGVTAARAKNNVLALMRGDASFPPLLSLEERAFFAVGYYQQRASFFGSEATPRRNLPGTP